MRFFARLFSRFQPPRIDDPTFGPLLFMYIKTNPALSYWEGEWVFPPTGHKVSVGLQGDENGPYPESRAFHLGLQEGFHSIVTRARPAIQLVFREYLSKSLSENLWDDVVLSGFDVEDPSASPPEWSVSFETKKGRWLSITVPFVGESPRDPVVDT